MTQDEGIHEVINSPGHVVILGAGASIASNAYNAELSGKKLPSMDSLIGDIGLNEILPGSDTLPGPQNFEDLYSQLFELDPESSTLHEIETRVYEYFDGMALPPTPTIYDYLVLSLRSKDQIATFNWDPFLYQAFSRNRSVADLPFVSFLHGNVSVGYSLVDERSGPAGWYSKQSKSEFVPTKLLYPIKHKNYNHDEFSQKEWDRLRRGLKYAGRVTIFGYGAPQSDIEAMEIMREAWGKSSERPIEQIEVIDVEAADVLLQRWNQIIYSDHYEITDNYFGSVLARFPRRTGEAYLHQFLPESEFEALQDVNQIPTHFETLKELWDWHAPLIKAEKARALNSE